MEVSMKVHHQFTRGLINGWDHHHHHHQQHEHSSSLTLGYCKRLRPLIPKQTTSSGGDNSSPFDLKSFIKPDCGSRKPDIGASLSDEKREPLNQIHPGGTRWNPTQEQIEILEMLYRGGMRTPNAQQIEQITTQLGKYGKIEGKNVFYWFQNHKARERQKQKRNNLTGGGGLNHMMMITPPRTSSTSFTNITNNNNTSLFTRTQVQQPQIPVTGGSGVAVAAANGSGASNQLVPTSLFIGDLDQSVTDSQLYDLFNQVGQVVSVRVCKDMTSGQSLGYGYVNYSSPQDAARAMEVLNFTPVNSKSIRVMHSHRDPTFRKSGSANIFIKNLDKAIDNKSLYDTFICFGNILSCKIQTDPSGQSKGYGFVQFDSEEAAQTAIDKLNGMLINDKQVYVGHFVRKQERDALLSRTKFNNIYVKNLSAAATDEDIKKIFGEYGTITSAVVMKDVEGRSKCFGFVNFDNADDAAKAVEALNGKTFDDKEWYVGKAQKKSERMVELKSQFEQTAKEQVDKTKGLNLYVKNLDDSIDDDKLKELFSDFGTITSCKVMRDPSGISRGSGFVAFSTTEEATRALSEMNGKMTVSKPLYVAVAQRKEERRARLQAQFSQMRPVAMQPAMAPRMPMYPPGAASFGQQIFYGQGPPAMFPSQPGFGYQHQMIPAMRPGGAPIPNFYMPMIPQGQRPGGRRGAGPVQQTQQPVPLMQQQMMPRGRMYRFPPARNAGDVTMPGVGGGVLPIPYDMSASLPRDAVQIQPMPISALASALANATAEQQRTMLGENLYPLVDQLEHDHAAKVTGMLLEMDQTEVLHLLESPEALKAKVVEALEVLKNVSQAASPAADQLANLSLNENLVS